MNLQSPPFVQHHTTNLADLGFQLTDVKDDSRTTVFVRLGLSYDYRITIRHAWQHNMLSVEIHRFYKDYATASLSKTMVFDGFIPPEAAIPLLNILTAVLAHP